MTRDPAALPERPQRRTASVADAMVTIPKVLPLGATVADARQALASEKVHLLLVVHEGVLLGTVDRADLDGMDGMADDGAVLSFATLEGRTIAPDVPLERAQRQMVEASVRRRAVVDAEGRLLGLLCLKRSLEGFCDDGGVLARQREREAR